MRKLASILLVLLVMAVLPLGAQNLGAPVIIQPQFNNATGVPLTSGKLCSYAAGTSTPLATYLNRNLTTQNANPMILGTGGYPQQPIYLDSVAYKFVVRLAGSDGTCSTGTIILTADYQYDLAALSRAASATKMDDKVCHTSQYTATSPNDFSGRTTLCIAALPSTGGTVDGRGDEGGQAWASDPFNGVTKSIEMLWPIGTTILSANTTVPSNVTMSLSQGSILSVNSGVVLTINGSMNGSSLSTHFSGSGTTTISAVPAVYPEWFTGVNAGEYITNAIAALPSTGGVVDASGYHGAQVGTSAIVVSKPRTTLLLGAMTYSFSSDPAISVAAANVNIIGTGSTVFTPTTLTGVKTIRVRASYATIEGIVFTGAGTAAVAEAQVYADEANVNYGTVRNCVFSNANYGVHVNNSTVLIASHSYGWRITDSTYFNMGTAAANPLFGYGVLIVSVNDFVVNRNFFLNIQRHAVYLSAGVTKALVSENIIDTIANVFPDGSAAILLNATTLSVNLVANSQNQIINNTITNSDIGIQANEYSNYNSICGNKLNAIINTFFAITQDGGSAALGWPTGNEICKNTVNSTAISANPGQVFLLEDNDGTIISDNDGSVSVTSQIIIVTSINTAAFNPLTFGFVAKIYHNKINSLSTNDGIVLNFTALGGQSVIIKDNEFPNIIDTLGNDYIVRTAGSLINLDWLQYRAIGGTTTLTTFGFYYCTNSLPATVTLPDPARVGTGKVYYVKDCVGTANLSSSPLTVASVAGTFDGGVGSYIIRSAFGVAAFRSNGTNWEVISTHTTNTVTLSNCADSAGAAACGGASAGAVVIDAAATSVVVSTTAVTADSEIFVTNDSSLNSRLAITCNTQSSLTLGTPRITARTTGVSFTITIEVGPTTNPMCINYFIVN